MSTIATVDLIKKRTVKMKEELEVGSTYDCFFSGMIWCFTVVNVDQKNERNL